ncbi:hypothetical protein GCM10010404_20240 [Nonomuraea africana]|uniref:Uncharacterized protein n=1 Tax=Nonomuraea africana TaxID=46171 RepID=A0ABR9KTB6_9ACTN|nr:PQQ-binding-like beta-propeller repeat protein [Nonomuraea africana]MBE1565283.1 hypothetical protein [Nonomuraea africana]
MKTVDDDMRMILKSARLSFVATVCPDRSPDLAQGLDAGVLWKLATGCGSAFSMQFLDDRLYIVTTDGSLACIDAGEVAIAAARAGSVPQPVDVKAAASLEVVEPSTALETVLERVLERVLETDGAGDGVVVECVKEGERLRVRVVSPGYESWNVQFPKTVREAGARYLVDGVRSAGRGGFYRAYGEIRRLL